MRYLKLYEEHSTIPDNFIRLDSIGHVLDPDEGLIYAMWKSGGYDHDNGYEVNEIEVQGLDDKDKEVLDKYWLSVEPFVKNKINFDLIENIKELSLDYLDDGSRLSIYVFFSDILALTEIFKHDHSSTNYTKRFKKDLDIISESNPVYYLRLDNKRNTYSPEESDNLRDLVMDYFPDEKILTF